MTESERARVHNLVAPEDGAEAMARRNELRDSQWEAIEDPLPGMMIDPGRTAQDNRLFVNALLFVLKKEIPRAGLTER